MSINQLTWGASALGGLLMGYLAQRFDAPMAMTFGGSVAIVATVLVGQRLLRDFGVGPQKADLKSGQEPGVTAKSST